MKSMPESTEMRRATLSRDRTYDGVFYVCVRSTRIFCRPSCPARKPLAKNTLYRSTVRDCLLDGFRPCRRCRPLAVGGDAPEWLGGLLTAIEKDPCSRITDTDLRRIGVDPHRARRYFTRNFDMTFQAYQRTRRMGLALERLRRGGDPLRVGLDHGFESSSGFRDAFERTFGKTPGASEKITCVMTTRVETPIGPLVAGATDDGVCLLEFADRRAFQKQIETLRRRIGPLVPGHNRHLDELSRQLGEYFRGERTDFTVPIVAPGSPFQEKVWNALREIPHGQTWSYDKLARRIDRAGAQRAVGRANGDNRIAILIPCHRVVRNDGTLCGYGGGLWRKQMLLDLEKAPANGK